MIRVMYNGSHARQLDLPSEITEGEGEAAKTRVVNRRNSGALHLHPGRVHVLTQDEFDLALKKDPTLRRNFHELGGIPKPEKKFNKTQTPKRAPEVDSKQSKEAKEAKKASKSG